LADKPNAFSCTGRLLCSPICFNHLWYSFLCSL
jgi:hypothetical protein